MTMRVSPTPQARASRRTVRVWDLPTRLFHWTLVAAVLAACISAQSGAYLAQRLHFLSGYAVLALVGFRIAWGFAGSHYARFAQFVRGPAATLRYARALLAARAGASPAGHNPLGALSVLGLLGLCGLQAATGLFSGDDIASEGPLARHVSNALVDRLTGLHDSGAKVLYALVALHLLALAGYRWLKRDDLVTPMITGDKPIAEGQPEPPAAVDRPLWPRAALLLGASLALVWCLVNLT
jgi:cytochrome b